MREVHYSTKDVEDGILWQLVMSKKHGKEFFQQIPSGIFLKRYLPKKNNKAFCEISFVTLESNKKDLEKLLRNFCIGTK